jgi:hypothetical protein
MGVCKVKRVLCRKLRDEYDRLEGALKKLGVDPDCSNTEVSPSTNNGTLSPNVLT